jgi:hypothetical protein
MIDAPVKPRGRPARTTQYSDEVDVGQRGDLRMETEGTDYADREVGIVTADSQIQSEYVKALSFNEEPVTIVINEKSEANPENAVFIGVNGRGAEMLMDGKWLEMFWLPIGVELTTKRKYLEQLLRSKKEQVSTKVEHTERSIYNKIVRVNALTQNVSIIKDANPIGAAWFRSIINDRV